MNCEKTQILLQGLADGELSGWRARRVERHLRGCERCAGVLAATVRLKEAFAETREEFAERTVSGSSQNDFFWSQVKRQIITTDTKPVDHSIESAPVLIWFGRGRFVVAATAVVAIFLGVMMVWEKGQIWGSSEVSNIQLPHPQTHHFKYVSEQSGNTFIWVYGLPTDYEEENGSEETKI